MKQRIGLYFGSFNPVHKGHIEVASYLLKHAPFDSVWFVPSPLNPHKSGETLIPAALRLEWVKKAITPYQHFECMDDEFHLSLPSYTYKSLLHFTQKYPVHTFYIIMGADNIHGFHTWQNAAELASIAPLHVYARPGYEKPPEPMPFGATWYDAPLLNISATEIRDRMLQGESAKTWVPETIYEDLKAFYQQKSKNHTVDL